MKPLIGISGRQDISARLHRSAMYSVGQTYIHAVQKVGGIPIIIPPTMAEANWGVLLPHLDGLLLSGGGDIHPAHYQQEAEPWLGGVDESRDVSELGCVRQWLSFNQPLLAICRGHQVLNVALGGSLYQDVATYIPDALEHAYTPARPMEQTAHSVCIAPDSQLAKILGTTTLPVNSAHHQAVKTLGNGLQVIANAPDGVVEALELSAHPFCLGIQWHPEAMVKISKSMWPLFEAFVNAAQG